MKLMPRQLAKQHEIHEKKLTWHFEMIDKIMNGNKKLGRSAHDID